jgi:hypothetical protein
MLSVIASWACFINCWGYVVLKDNEEEEMQRVRRKTHLLKHLTANSPSSGSSQYHKRGSDKATMVRLYCYTTRNNTYQPIFDWRNLNFWLVCNEKLQNGVNSLCHIWPMCLLADYLLSLLLTLKMEAVHSSKNLAKFYQTTQHRTLKDSTLQMFLGWSNQGGYEWVMQTLVRKPKWRWLVRPEHRWKRIKTELKENCTASFKVVKEGMCGWMEG